jgi:beta-phosphoglucomutase
MTMQPGMALIFDLDGVIVDSNPVHKEAWRVYNRRFGIETGESIEQRMYGRRNDEIVRDFFGAALDPGKVAAHGAAKEKLYREMMAARLSESLVPGVTDFLERESAAPTGLATNAEPANVNFVLDGIRIGERVLRDCFQVVVDGHQVSRPKPDPEVYLRAAALLGVEPRNCVVFEDSYAGVDAARASGARVVAVRTTHTEFKNIDLSVDNFHNPELEIWLDAQKPV